jgi:allophanate hydrolase
LLAGAVLVLPTTGGTFTRDEVRESPVASNSQLGWYTNHCNLLDLAALALPAAWAGERLPFGITLFALPENTGGLFAAARLLSRADAVFGAPSGALAQDR